jgi:D-glycero-D-manno-heptose 1,7-bisphosphate phosphatase
MQKAIFIDRDGVINNDTGHYYIYKPEHFVLNNGLVEVLQKWQQKGYIFIVITNQGGIARGTYTKGDVEKVHSKFLSLMGENNINITEIYYCPHHNKFEKCICRKPDSLLFEKAIARFNIDIKKSYMIGDSVKDIEAAKKVGLKAVKIDTNESLKNIENLID